MSAVHKVIGKSWRIIVVGGHTRSIGKTQLVCDVIEAFREANWIAGKITQYGHNFCVKKGKFCDCAPTEHVCALTWENGSSPRADSGRFLTAGARRAFWLRTKQGYLAEGVPLLRAALQDCDIDAQDEPGNLILESNTLLDFVTPSLYLMVLDPAKADFKNSARQGLDRASAFIWRGTCDAPSAATATWPALSSPLVAEKPRFLQREGEVLPDALRETIHTTLRQFAGVAV